LNNGVIIYEGPSAIDGSPIVVIATGLRRQSQNEKTGDLLQVWILPRDTLPGEAIRTGRDGGVCGDCIHRANDDGRSCYVATKTINTVWRAYQRGSYPPLATYQGTIRPGIPGIRWGAYGDPAAIPYHAAIRFGAWATARGVRSVTHRAPGYTQRWQTSPWLRGHAMASVATVEAGEHARSWGWRTFRVALDETEGPGDGEIWCPATPDGGSSTSCDRCGLCDGSRGPADRRKSIVAKAHGSGAAAFRRRRRLATVG